ncbi:MAG: DUF2807 domain-containing protein [Flavobacteriaceae bacterium]|nr:MAG: DUF2807 domain-containing protein [Flavobacteriaceae bacterium]
MKKITFLFLLASTVMFAQEPTLKKLGDFNTIKLFNGLTLNLIKSNEASIQLFGEKANDVVYKNINGMLKISMKFPETFSAKDVSVTVYFTDDLHTIDANEGSIVQSSDVLKGQNLELRVQEGAHINLEIKAKYLSLKAISGGILTLDGETINQSVEVNTGGIYEGYNLSSVHTDIMCSTGGQAGVHVTEDLDANVRFGGAVTYKGNPNAIQKNKFLGGKIKAYK